MFSKICTCCSIQKTIENFYKKSTECITCNSNRSVKRYCGKRFKTPTQKNLMLNETEIKFKETK